MKNNGSSWQPTITLAKLFEEQNQFYDALAAYELIGQNDSSPAIRERIDALHLRILSDPNGRYDSRIEKLFTPEELAYLKILNHQGFNNMATTMEKLSDGMQGSDLIFDSVMPDEVLADENEDGLAVWRGICTVPVQRDSQRLIHAPSVRDEVIFCINRVDCFCRKALPPQKLGVAFCLHRGRKICGLASPKRHQFNEVQICQINLHYIDVFTIFPSQAWRRPGIGFCNDCHKSP